MLCRISTDSKIGQEAEKNSEGPGLCSTDLVMSRPDVLAEAVVWQEGVLESDPRLAWEKVEERCREFLTVGRCKISGLALVILKP